VATVVTATATVLLAAALAANVFGWLGLSSMLTGASIAGLFSALSWTIVVAAITALLPAVLQGGVGRVLPSLRRESETVCRITSRTVALVAVIAWSHTALTRFGLWQSLRNYAIAIAESGFSIGGLTISTGGLLGAILILGTVWLLARLVGFFMREEVLPRLRMRRGAGQSVVTMTNYTIWGIGFVMAASALGLGGTQLTVVIGALGVGIGFGLQNIVNNFVSGLILIFERPINVGDTIQTGEHWGRVKHIGIRASTIHSFDGAEIMVPNGDLIAHEVINWTRSDDLRRIQVLVGVAYGTEPEEVLEILRRVADEHPLTFTDPEPTAHMLRFGESSLDFRLRCWTRVDDRIAVAGDLHVAINAELKKAGITIPFPQRDMHMYTTVPAPADTPESVVETIQGPSDG
jgi:small-conductance mechanosensitive channel